MSGVSVRWESVTHAYDQGPVLRDVSLTIEPGESVVLLGHNGAGKTTLTRMLAGLVRPTAGRVMVGDWDAARKRPDELARRIGYVFQHADQQLFARTVRADVAFGPVQLGLGDAGVDKVLVELGLAPHASRHPYDLPSPLRKLVTIAGVLAMQCPVLVLDEPTAGFDRELRQVVLAALRVRLTAGVSVIAVSHDLALVRALALREVVLEHGAVVADRRSGTTA